MKVDIDWELFKINSLRHTLRDIYSNFYLFFKGNRFLLSIIPDNINFRNQFLFYRTFLIMLLT